MELKPAKCPNCGGELQLPNSKVEATCVYCDSRIIVSEAINAMKNDLQPLLKIMEDAYEAAGDGKDLQSYANKVLEIDSNNALAMFYKGMAHCWMNKISEGIVFIKKAINPNSPIEFKERVYHEVVQWSAYAFDHFYNLWSYMPGSDLHCDNKWNRLRGGFLSA